MYVNYTSIEKRTRKKENVPEILKHTATSSFGMGTGRIFHTEVLLTLSSSHCGISAGGLEEMKLFPHCAYTALLQKNVQVLHMAQ